ncbi:MAG: hypothetical protein M1454_05385 [Candidatus Thermoplasmatota archaeon]|nr:hypothetical protein [Candidatus Thermoplasmatota archaeon]MCL5730676.1 hypothetical protein [Candidatus Thermoplasmatota archaeon]
MENNNSAEQDTFDTVKLLKAGKIGGIFFGVALLFLSIGAIIMTVGALVISNSSGISVSGYIYADEITFDIGAIVLLLLSMMIIRTSRSDKLPEGYTVYGITVFLFFLFLAISEIIYYAYVLHFGGSLPSGFIYAPIELIVGAVLIFIASTVTKSKTLEGKLTGVILGIVGIILVFISYLFNPVSAVQIAYATTAEANFAGFIYYPAFLIYFFGIFGSYSALAFVAFLVLAAGIIVTFFIKKGKGSIMLLFEVIAAMVFAVGLLVTGIITSTGKYFTDFNLPKYVFPYSSSYYGIVNASQVLLLISGVLLLISGILLIIYTIVKLVETSKQIGKEFNLKM